MENTELDKKIIDKAMTFATQKHSRQFRKGTTIPYIVHPYEVMQILKEIGADTEVVVAGILHDTLEDTDTTYAELEREFGKTVADLVLYETEDKSKPYAERKKEHMNRIAHAPIQAKIINCADKLSNIRATLIDYKREGETFWDRFDGTKEQIQHYYALSFESLKDLKDTDMYKEFKQKYNEIFAQKPLSNNFAFVYRLKKAELTRFFGAVCKIKTNLLSNIIEINKRDGDIVVSADCDYLKYSPKLTIKNDFTATLIKISPMMDQIKIIDQSENFTGYLYKIFGEEYGKAYFEHKKQVSKELTQKPAQKSKDNTAFRSEEPKSDAGEITITKSMQEAYVEQEYIKRYGTEKTEDDPYDDTGILLESLRKSAILEEYNKHYGIQSAIAEEYIKRCGIKKSKSDADKIFENTNKKDLEK